MPLTGEYLKKLAENVKEVMWLTSFETGEEKILYCSPAYEEIWGRKVEELYNDPRIWLDSILPEYRLAVETAFNSVFETKSFDIQFKIKRPDGSIRWIRDRGWPDGNNVAGIAHDITEIKSAQQELQNFAYAASHDLQEPLRIINGYAYMIKSTAQNLPPTFEYYIGHIMDATKRMSEMLDGLLSYSRINRDDQFVSLNLKTVIYQAKENLSDTITTTGTKITVKNSTCIYGIKGQMIQIFQNLISNAIKFHKPDVIPNIEIGISEEDKNKVIIYVKDNGIGIHEDYFNKIFQIFKKLHAEDSYPGRGVGLGLVKQIIEHHGGQVWLTSKIDKGTTFYFSLPKTYKECNE